MSSAPMEGLGLYIHRQIVAAYGGPLHVENPLGQEACFRVALPLGPRT